MVPLPAGGGLPPITGGDAGPSAAELAGGNIIFSSPFAVGSGAKATATPDPLGIAGGGLALPLILAGAAALVLVLVLRR